MESDDRCACDRGRISLRHDASGAQAARDEVDLVDDLCQDRVERFRRPVDDELRIRRQREVLEGDFEQFHVLARGDDDRVAPVGLLELLHDGRHLDDLGTGPDDAQAGGTVRQGGIVDPEARLQALFDYGGSPVRTRHRRRSSET